MDCASQSPSCSARSARLKPGKWLLIAGAALLVLSATLVLAHEPLLLAVGNLLVVQDVLEPADLIVIVSGGPARDDYGFQLYQQGYGDQIFITGGVCPIHGHDANYLTARAAELGLPRDTILFTDEEVISTYGEAEKLEAYLTAHRLPVRSVIVVTAPYHTWRTRWAFRQTLGDGVRVQMAPVPFEPSPYGYRWWTNPELRRLVAREYGKMAYYLARYKYSAGPLRDWLASLDKG